MTSIDLRQAFPTMAAGVFDMDDLMIDSHPVHMELFREVMVRHGAEPSAVVLSPGEEAGLFGKRIADCWKVFLDKAAVDVDVATLQADFDTLMLPVFERADIQPMPGLFQLLERLQAVDLPLAVASSAVRDKIHVVLHELAAEKFFSEIVSGDQVARGKPAPDIFLKAAEQLGVDADKCVVFEDARNGVEAAKAAGMFAVGVHNQFSAQRLGIRQDLSAADVQVDELSNVTVGPVD